MVWDFRHILGGLLAIAAFPALAQVTTIPVRGGEHAEYTRLAITLPPDVTWQVSQDGRQATLLVQNLPIQFDLSQTFARIPRSRLASIDLIENGLVLFLNCDCTVRAAEDLPQMLVLDLLLPTPGAGTLSADTPRPRPRPARLSPAAVATQAGITLAQSLRDPAATATLPSIPILSAAKILIEPPLVTDLQPDPALPVDLDAQSTDAQVQTLTALGNALGIAVGHGLLAPVAPDQFSSAGGATGSSPHPTGSSSTLPQQLAVADSVTRGRTMLRPTVQDATEPHCPSPGAIAIQDWGNATTAQRSRPDLGKIYTEMDQANQTAIRQVARDLLYLGFGAEAKVVISLLDPPAPEDTLLLSLANLIDLSPTAAAPFPLSMAQCGEMGALWAALDRLPKDLPADFPVAQAVRGVAVLPPHLRLHLGPVLLRNLLAQGQTSQAHILRDILARVAADVPPATTAGTTNDSTDDTLAKPQGLNPPDDVLFALQHALQSGAPVPHPLVEEAQALLFTLRGSETASQLGQAAALALAINGDFTEAFALGDSREAGLDQTQRTTLRGQLFTSLTAQADDAFFLTQIFAADPWNDPVTPTIMAEMAERLQRLGFDSPANDLRKQGQQSGLETPFSMAARDANAELAAETQMQPQNDPQSQPALVSETAAILASVAANQAEAPLAVPRPESAREGEAPLSGSDLQVNRPDTAPSIGQGDAAIPTHQVRGTAPPKSAGPVEANEAGLLAAGRQALADSTALRARLGQLLPDP